MQYQKLTRECIISVDHQMSFTPRPLSQRYTSVFGDMYLEHYPHFSKTKNRKLKYLTLITNKRRLGSSLHYFPTMINKSNTVDFLLFGKHPIFKGILWSDHGH